MPLDNFYEEKDKAAYRWRNTVGLAFLALAVYLIFGYWFFANNQEEQAVRQKEADRIAHIDALCTNLPLPENFRFVMRNNPISYNDGTAIVYRYKSDRELEEIMPAFLVWFRANGWKPAGDDSSSFTKGEQTVSIRKPDYDFANYEIYCHENEISFGIH